MNTEDLSRKKYRLSLLYLVIDLLKSMLVGAIVFFVFIFILTVGIMRLPFSDYSFREIFDVIIMGAGIGLLYRCLKGNDEFDDYAEVDLYNMYAGIHNTFVFADAGSGYGATLSLIEFFLSLLGLVFKLGSAVVVVPVSLVYLCIMSILETIFNGIPKTLGNILDKLIPLFSIIGGCIAVILVLVLMNK